jgi:hypothetical protein
MQFLGSAICDPSSPKLSKIAVERCEVKRAKYILDIADEPAENLVFVDECSVNQLNTYRENGWAVKGQRARKRSRFVRGTRFVECLKTFNFLLSDVFSTDFQYCPP